MTQDARIGRAQVTLRSQQAQDAHVDQAPAGPRDPAGRDDLRAVLGM
jgi:hypothetical protein